MIADLLLPFLRAHQHETSQLGDLARELLADRQAAASAANTCPCSPADQRRQSCWKQQALADSAARIFESGLRNNSVSLEAARRWCDEYERAKICEAAR